MILLGEALPPWFATVRTQLFLSIGTRDHALHCNAMDGHTFP